jgi:hypothetical protein
VAAFVILIGTAFIASGSPAQASFHFMQIEQVIGGVNGDVTAQAIQLRMRDDHQNLVSQARVRAWDAEGANAVLIIDMNHNVSNHNLGSHVLIVSSNFIAATDPDAVPDFVMTNLIPASYLAAGSVTFEDNFGTVYWRLSWGGVNYHGSTTGNTTNDDDPGSPANFGPPFAGPLPSTTLQALRFKGTPLDLSTTNANDYALSDTAAIFTNNAEARFLLPESEPIVGDLDGDGDMDLDDYAICSACLAGPNDPIPPALCDPQDFAGCDLNPDGRVDLADFADFTLLLTGM